MTPLSFVTWLWRPAPGYRSQFDASHVNVLFRMVRRHYDGEMRAICVTDMPKGIDQSIEIVPAWNDFARVQSPHGGHNPSCYRRLRAFHPEIATTFGDRFVSLDLDVVVTGPLRPLFERDADFMIWGETDPRSWYNGSMFMLRAGARPKVWTKFDPVKSPRAAKRAGRFGSDQGWISYVLGKGEATWTRDDGVYSWRVHVAPKGGKLPPGARIVMFHGKHDPWSYECQQVDWIRENWH